MKKLTYIFLLAGLFNPISSWASFYHYGHYALQIPPEDKAFLNQSSIEPKSGLAISGAIDSLQSTNYFGAFDFVLENKSDQWIVLKDIKVSFLTPEQNQNISIPTGAQFSAWSEGMQNSQNYNQKKAALVGIFIGGAMMANGQSQEERNVGAVATGVSIAALASANSSRAMLGALPTGHLLGGDIAIPPGLFLKRWLVVNSSKHKETGYVHTIVIEFKDANSNPQKYYLPFRDRVGTNIGGWQTDFKVGDGYKMKFAE